MKYAITGNRGLIGTFLNDKLQEKGHRCVMKIDKKEGFNVCQLLNNQYELGEKPDVFFHFAAQCKINEAIANPELPHNNNANGIFAVLEFCRKHKIPKIVAASSSRVLSKERNPYTASKVYLEEMVKAYSDCYGIEHIIIRPSTVYGPMEDETSRLMSTWVTNALKGRPLQLYGDASKTLDFTYVDDFVDGVILTTTGKWNNDYNISGESEVNLFNLANYIINLTNGKSEIELSPPEKAQPQHVFVDTSKIKELGYKPKVNIWEGTRRMVQFYKANPTACKEYQDKGKIYYNGVL